MKLKDLGFGEELNQYCLEHRLDLQNIGRVISEHKARYVVRTESGDHEAIVTGKLVYDAEGRYDFPATGDWVELRLQDEGVISVNSILPRSSILERRAAGKMTAKQIIATNIDYVLIVQAVNRDFNVNRIERYLTICAESGIKPIVVLSKSDLVDQESLRFVIDELKDRVADVPVVSISSTQQIGFDELDGIIEKGRTYCLIGSSGAGKSTLLNILASEELMKTGEIGDKTNRGRHVTTHRELVVLPSGGIIIDNPGMRELGIADAKEGLNIAFDDIIELASQCRFKNCSHVKDEGCAILAALGAGDIDRLSYDNYLRMQREAEHYQSSERERRQKAKNLARKIKNAKRGKKTK